MHKLGAKFGLILLSILAAAGLASGIAHADAQPGSADSSSSTTVQVDQNSSDGVTITTDSTSTTTVGASSDGQSSTPAITIDTDQTGGPGTTVNDPAKSIVQNNEQSPKVDTGNQPSQSAIPSSSVSVPPSGNVTFSHPVSIPMAKLVHNTTPVAPSPVVPTPESKNQPAPVTNGSVTPVLGNAPGSTGKGMTAKLTRVFGGLNAASVVALLTLLSLISGCFMSYLRRSRFRHAPRSDASAAFYFATPRVETQDLLEFRAVPVFSSVLNTNQLIGKKGGECI